MQIDSPVAGLTALPPPLRRPLADRLLAMADDELTLAHRNSEWCGHAPILEEDIAFANIAQDELGHAGLWYGLLQALDDSDPDRLVYFRSASEFRNARLLELPKGDWAFSILRQFLFDSYELCLLPRLSAGALQPLAHAAEKARREELYHLRHTHAWVRRLGLGTDESRRRMQAALDALWPHVPQLFQPLAGDAALVEAAIIPPWPELQRQWSDEVIPYLVGSGLQLPAQLADPQTVEGRDRHTPHLHALQEELQSVARMDPEASW